MKSRGKGDRGMTDGLKADQLVWLFGFGLVLLIAQFATGTPLAFALLVFAGLVAAGLTVAVLGGVTTLPGFCVAMLALKFLVVSQVSKTVLFEPATSNLSYPMTTIGALVIGMFGLLLAAWCTRLIGVRRVIIEGERDVDKLHAAAIVSLSIGLFSYLVVKLFAGGEGGGIRVGGVFGILRQLSFFLGLSIALGTACTIVRSGGTRLFSWLNAIPFSVQFLMGFVDAGRMKMIEPVVLLLLTALAFGYRFRPRHGLAALVAVAFGYFFLIPFGHVARSETRDPDFERNIASTMEFLERHFVSREGWKQFYNQYDESLADLGNSYFDEPNGLLDRLSLIKPMDMLVAGTVEEGESGWETVSHGFKMLPPRKLYPQKPPIGTGTILGHRAGVLDESDNGTQVSFGFIADSFSSFGWLGVAVIPCLIGLGFFLVYGSLVGPLRDNVWCVSMMAHFQHYFAENSIAAMILTIFQQSIVFLFAYFLLKLVTHYWPSRGLAAYRDPDACFVEQRHAGS